ncbi:hypothetical protein KSF73_16745 [Burkholderiaceae bacterium DAT-1]|nr:hypothetical protein [Burkholderiaceae bacterium DAT-1]
MLIFLDTEYTDPIDSGLISIALITEDGSHHFYAELSDFKRDMCSAFVHAAVLPLLDAPPDQIMDRGALNRCLHTWFARLPEPGVIAYDDRTDVDLLLDALGDTTPANLAGYHNLRPAMASPMFNEAVCQYHAQPNQPWPHAWHDANALRAGWMAWQPSPKDPS